MGAGMGSRGLSLGVSGRFSLPLARGRLECHWISARGTHPSFHCSTHAKMRSSFRQIPPADSAQYRTFRHNAIPMVLSPKSADSLETKRNSDGKKMADPPFPAHNSQTGYQRAAVYEATAHRITRLVSNTALDQVSFGFVNLK